MGWNIVVHSPGLPIISMVDTGFKEDLKAHWKADSRNAVCLISIHFHSRAHNIPLYHIRVLPRS